MLNKEQSLAFFLPLLVAAVLGLMNQYRYESLYGELDNSGVLTQATIISKQLIRRGTDRPNFAYEMLVGFTVGERMLRGRVLVTNGFYNQHEPSEVVPIRYLPDDPKIREIDPAMRDKSARSNLVIICILVFIGFANIIIVGGKTELSHRNE